MSLDGGMIRLCTPLGEAAEWREYKALNLGETFHRLVMRIRNRDLMECFFNKFERFRRIFMRYDKLLRNYLSFAYIGAMYIWLR
ncbi:hypothetical protein PN498_15180 [Oscillatoria sp. CS-180]|uniref:hypothetical protein n=1 Tax=Oscillatoria sp. CS-180 TaxID=3021720 RepID=UPI002330E319|nr:hypothetical protein [Oscillatoria sp. CS-180]MDB9527341.1 hypothetical protein [Oscillatoria sp. CS-180]